MAGIAGEGCPVIIPEQGKKPLAEIEKSIVKKFRKTIWAPFTEAVQEYTLIEEGDRIAVAISGGKDSLLMAKLFQEIKRHRKMNFDIEFIAMDPGYHPQIRELLAENCHYLNIPVQIYESKIFSIIDQKAQDYPCYLCAKMRRGSLYSKAQELGCGKLALGHHFNDVIETTMLNLLYAGNFKTMLPKLKSTNFKNMELIRPMFHIEESAILEFIDYCGISPLNCACMVAAKRTGSKRREIKTLIEQLKQNYDRVDDSIFAAATNVNLDAIIGWQKDGKKHSYLESYKDGTDTGEDFAE
ncbi:MAG: tRNA 2-thiocytidine biosynthesis TtcA family protein [Spirochaetota bacterium]